LAAENETELVAEGSFPALAEVLTGEEKNFPGVVVTLKVVVVVMVMAMMVKAAAVSSRVAKTLRRPMTAATWTVAEP